MRKRGFFHAFAQAYDRAENDRVRMTLDDLLDEAVERSQRVRQNRSPRREGGPARAVETARTMNPAASAKAMRKRFVARRKKIDREGARLAQTRERRGEAGQANEEGWRGQREGCERR